MPLRGYRARWIVDGTGGPVHPGIVLFDNAWIVDVVGPSAAPSDAEIEDLGDVAILPGLIDAHVHLAGNGTSTHPEAARSTEEAPLATIRAVRNAADTIQCGTTTVRDVGSPHGVALALREAVAAGIVPGPRILASGVPLVMSGGHGHAPGLEVDGPFEMRKAARQQLGAGADLLKLHATGGITGPRGAEPWSTQLELDELQAGIREAHKANCAATVHAQGEEGIANAIDAEADTIEHGNQLTRELAERMARRGMLLVPTLIAFVNLAEAPADSGLDPDHIRKARMMGEASARAITLAKTAGVRIAAGTDAGSPLVPHGSVRREIELLAQFGLTTHAAIQAATRVAAEALRLENSVGTLEHGKYADLIVVGGDPLADLGALYDLRLVLKGGEVVHREAGLGGRLSLNAAP